MAENNNCLVSFLISCTSNALTEMPGGDSKTWYKMNWSIKTP